METVLVTGGAGFLGSHVAEYLCRMGQKVVVLDDLSGGFGRNVPEGALFRLGTITDPEFVHRLFEQYRFTHVYHLAAYAAEGLSHFIRHFNYTNNLLGSINLINAAVATGVRCFVFTSSMAVYGEGQVPFTEEMVPWPEDPYGVAKLAVEQDLQAAAKLFDLGFIIFRPHNIYGVRQNLSDPYRNVIGIFMKQVLHGQPCTLFGDGSQMRAFSYVGDIAPLIAESVLKPEVYGQTFNIGADRPYALSEVAAMVQKVLGRDVGIRTMPPRHEVHHAWCDHTKARQVFGDWDTTDLGAGLVRMGRWAETMRPRAPRLMNKLEIQRELPPSWARLAEAPKKEKCSAGG